MQSTENLIGTKSNVETDALSAVFHCRNKGIAEEGSRGRWPSRDDGICLTES